MLNMKQCLGFLQVIFIVMFATGIVTLIAASAENRKGNDLTAIVVFVAVSLTLLALNSGVLVYKWYYDRMNFDFTE